MEIEYLPCGEIWHNISDAFFDIRSIGDIAVFHENPSIIYVGTGATWAKGEMSTYAEGAYKSTEAGRTWTYIDLSNTKEITLS